MTRVRALTGIALLALSALTTACATIAATPTLSDEQRCARFGGNWRSNSRTCGGGGGP